MPDRSRNKISSFLRAEIGQLFKKARLRVRYSGIRILQGPKKQDALGKVLIVTPKSCGNAPERNLFRRRIKALFREQNLGSTHTDLVVITNKRGVGVPFSKLREILLYAVRENRD